MAAKAKKQKASLKDVRPSEVIPVEIRLAKAADKHAMHEKDVQLFSDILKEFDIDYAEINPDVVRAARKINRNKVEAMEAKLDAFNEAQRAKLPAPSGIEVIEELADGTIVPDRAASSPAKASEASKPAKAAKPADIAPKPLKALAFEKYPATAVIRWMGQQGWSVEQAVNGIEGLKLSVSVDTIRIQLRAGAKGDGSRGEPAPLSPSEEKVMKKFKKGS